jgi:deoxyadenosine/deoxycytidine kinase
MKAQKKFRYISVMGTMGSGKTTAARLIAKELHYHLVEENFGENAFLPRFYKRMKRWAFHSQTFFLMEKINQLMEIGEELSLRGSPERSRRTTKQSLRYKGIIQDTPIEQDVFSYARAQHVLGNMDDAEWKLYQKIYRSFEQHLPRPDIIIFLETSTEEIIKRISNRGRGYEKKIPKKYLLLLERLNQEWMSNNKNRKILKIKTDGLNIVTSKSAQHNFIRQLHHALT